mmetsp:Transcript_120255/g.345700  ORF Transcript_120255/g.345700 Transcript_120255/m.345700 type:complete len:296 (+) Transcript_120255:280-1167(+)
MGHEKVGKDDVGVLKTTWEPHSRNVGAHLAPQLRLEDVAEIGCDTRRTSEQNEHVGDRLGLRPRCGARRGGQAGQVKWHRQQLLAIAVQHDHHNPAAPRLRVAPEGPEVLREPRAELLGAFAAHGPGLHSALRGLKLSTVDLDGSAQNHLLGQRLGVCVRQKVAKRSKRVLDHQARGQADELLRISSEDAPFLAARPDARLQVVHAVPESLRHLEACPAHLRCRRTGLRRASARKPRSILEANAFGLAALPVEHMKARRGKHGRQGTTGAAAPHGASGCRRRAAPGWAGAAPRRR